MQAEIQINNSADAQARYVGWTPSPCRIRLVDTSGMPPQASTVKVRLSSSGVAGGGKVRFIATPGSTPKPTIKLDLKRDGSSALFSVAGQFGYPSINDGDVTIKADVGSQTIGAVSVMVRVRKNATRLTAGERDRFISAMAQLNNQGSGRFADFRNMHVNAGSPEAHGQSGFLPWHRAYLLDLERELQAIDPSVSLPYWRFDKPAPTLFKRDYLGEPDALGALQWSATNPLQFWVTDGQQGINRRPLFNTGSSGANVIGEAATLALGSNYSAFRDMEGDPHGSAHTSFGGFISSIGTAARDPLFFLLHCNVDRLWAKWQAANNRFDAATAASYDGGGPGGNRIGHNLPDTMWPWNGVTGAPRPSTAPGGPLANSPCVSAPGPSPRVRDGLDYQGRVSAAARLGFDYDDVAFA